MSDPPRQAVQSAWAIFEALRRLGFKSDDIFMRVGREVTTMAWTFFVVLRVGEAEFNVIAGDLADEKDGGACEREWFAWATDVSSGRVEEEVLQKIWREHFSSPVCIASLVNALAAKGIGCPKLVS